LIYDSTQGLLFVNWEYTTSVIDDATLSEAVYYDGYTEGATPDYTYSFLERLQEWYGISESYGTLKLEGSDVLFSYSVDTAGTPSVSLEF